jgi:hypothetical protein
MSRYTARRLVLLGHEGSANLRHQALTPIGPPPGTAALAKKWRRQAPPSFGRGNARGSERLQTSTRYFTAGTSLALTPINLLHHVIARRRAHGDLKVPDRRK